MAGAQKITVLICNRNPQAYVGTGAGRDAGHGYRGEGVEQDVGGAWLVVWGP